MPSSDPSLSFTAPFGGSRRRIGGTNQPHCRRDATETGRAARRNPHSPPLSADTVELHLISSLQPFAPAGLTGPFVTDAISQSANAVPPGKWIPVEPRPV